MEEKDWRKYKKLVSFVNSRKINIISVNIFKMYPRILKVKIFIYFKAYITPCQVSKSSQKRHATWQNF